MLSLAHNCVFVSLSETSTSLMASSEVNVHVEEVVVVTTPDGAGEGSASEVKTVLVATELTQPGEELADGSIESETDATTTLTKEAILVKLSGEMDVEADVVYPVTCGDVKATLVWKKFVCPGINIKCVQFNEHLISPKEFVYMAGKSTLKDWKRAIRVNGTMIRKIMDSGELDFYQHSKVCSNTCRSTKIDLVGTRVSLRSQQSTDYVPVTPSSADMNGSQATFPTEVSSDETTEWVTAIGEDSVTFWRGLKEAGLLEEVVEDFQKEIQEVLKGMQERITEPPLQVNDAVLLNNIVQNFGMLDLVKKVLASHKSQMDRYREQYSRSLVALEQQCDEHRKRAKELKSKSQHLNNVLMNLTPVATPPTPKRPRLTRAVSGPAVMSSAPTQITLPLTQLTGLPAGCKVLSMGGAVGAGQQTYTVLTSPVGELGPDASNLTVLSSAAAVQEGAAATTAFIKMVSPGYQLITLPAALGTQLQGFAGGTLQGTPTMVAMPMGNNALQGMAAVTALDTQVDVQVQEAKETVEVES
ncbi:glucocorticoid modulatory element-binding protein 2-like isoform X1 [Oncorhynchus nerka]|uniref:glucocorticoid modulatory element-binding protein 2-like isoform X1 n=2 Tax=Oncorhynchus nerka TaxID=8023 RepID=UPI001131671A|nr:glucocorticoid modulatory element-binding protein 2-like isoform X1 [Oncorhynchus nerka]